MTRPGTGGDPGGEAPADALSTGEPDYRTHTIDSLRDILRHIDAERFPERAARLKEEIALRIANPGVYEPPRPDGLAWWRAHWPRVLGIAGILIGLAGAAGQGAGMMAVFGGAAEPPLGAAPAGSEKGPSGSDAPRRGGPGGGAARGAPAPMAPVFWVVTVPPPGTLDLPAWYRSFLAGARFAGMATGALLLIGGILLLLRRGEGVFYWITAFAVGFSLTALEQAASGAAVSVPTGRMILAVILNIVLTAALIAPAALATRSALKR